MQTPLDAYPPDADPPIYRPPLDADPPTNAGTPPPPTIHGILRDTVNKRTVRILLECFLVLQSIKTQELEVYVIFHSA